MENQTELNVIWESLGIANDFIFGKVMQDAELCKDLLQRIQRNCLKEAVTIRVCLICS